jgi:hypothetical protein
LGLDSLVKGAIGQITVVGIALQRSRRGKRRWERRGHGPTANAL